MSEGPQIMHRNKKKLSLRQTILIPHFVKNGRLKDVKILTTEEFRTNTRKWHGGQNVAGCFSTPVFSSVPYLQRMIRSTSTYRDFFVHFPGTKQNGAF